MARAIAPKLPARRNLALDSEMARIKAIEHLCGQENRDLASQAVKDGWTLSRTEVELLKKLRNDALRHEAERSHTAQVLEAACVLTAKLQNADKHYDSSILEAAERKHRCGLSLQELLLEAAYANGMAGRTTRISAEVLRFAFSPNLVGGFTTVDTGGILSNIANKFLLEGFFSIETTWRNLAAIRNVSDFKEVVSYRLVGTDQYEPVAPGGKIKHGVLGEEEYRNQADTYALMLTVDRRDILNDDLGAISTVPRKLGRGSGLKINDVFWKVFLDNAGFFKAGNKNLLEGADTALSIDGLTKAEVAFMDQTDADGQPIGVMPSILLLPTALSALGTQLRNSTELRDTTANSKFPVSNPHQGKFRIEVSRYLNNARFTGNSAKAWYLLAAPEDLPTIEVAFLNGQESPTIETADADFSVLGVRMRGYHDFGVALQDPRGAVKAKGEA